MSGTVALLLIIFSAVSVIPPVDAFTVSRYSQISLAESALNDNGMLIGDRVKPDGSIPAEDKKKIDHTIQYLGMMQDLVKVPWLPDDFDPYEDSTDLWIPAI
jgi:hypothetical protein